MKPDTHIILGFDPGFGRLGFGCLRAGAGDPQVIDYGVITTDAGSAFDQRLVRMGRDIETLLDAHAPDVVGIEKLYFSKNAKTAMQVAESRGVVLYLCAKRGIPCAEYTPSQIKKAVSGNGNADKKAMQWMVSEILGLERAPKIDDAADALAVALTAMGSMKHGLMGK